MKLSIIIPTFNESKTIWKSLKNIVDNLSEQNDIEIIVVDGGSNDNTVKIVRDFENVKLVESPKGRGRQMNTAAKLAKGQVLYFLHADSIPPKNFDQYIFANVYEGNKAGCFKMKFDYKHWWLFLAGWFTQFNVKFFRGGDQSLFIEKQLFNQLGGYPENFSIFEDYEFVRKLYRINEFSVIQKNIITSARRYRENGVAKLQYYYWCLYLKKWGGASKKELESYYKKNVR